MTKVVNLRHADYDVYIGRAGRGHDGYFGNPYAIGHHCQRCKRPHPTPSSTLLCYREYFYERITKDPEFYRRIIELKGKTLGCFCKPGDCHGDVIVEFLEGQWAW